MMRQRLKKGDLSVSFIPNGEVQKLLKKQKLSVLKEILVLVETEQNRHLKTKLIGKISEKISELKCYTKD